MKILILLSIGSVLSAVAGEAEVYKANIKKGDKLGVEWKLRAKKDCVPKIEKSPQGNRVFIARIPTGKQSLKLAKLPKHTHLRVKFDLILKGTWDGTHKENGPDSWKFDIDGRQSLVNSTFCNMVGKLQTFPDFQTDKYELNSNFTSTAEAQTLGYKWVDGERNQVVDSVYSFHFLIPHSKSSVSLNFESKFNDIGSESNKDQWYGLDNIEISALTDPPQLSSDEIEKQVGLLQGNHSVKRSEARLALLSSDASFVKWLEKNYAERGKINLDKWVKLLSHEDFEERTKAMRHIELNGLVRREALKKTARETNNPEVRSRLNYVLQQWGELKGKSLSSFMIEQEFIRLLKTINTKESNALLAVRSKIN